MEVAAPARHRLRARATRYHAAMEPAANIAELLRAPIGRYLAGRWFVIWVYDRTLLGTVYFGKPAPQDFDELPSAFPLLRHDALAPSYDVLVDCRGVEAIPAESFAFLMSYLAVARESAVRMRRVSVVRPSGLPGATLAGVFFDAIRPDFCAALFSDRVEAAEWLGHQRASNACVELDLLVARVRQTPDELLRLRAYIDTHLTHANLPTAAAATAIPTRTLQRLLKEANTSFRAEVEHARMRAAERLLCDSQTPIDEVARQVGFSSSAHFATAFRRVTGETPTDFRSRRR